MSRILRTILILVTGVAWLLAGWLVVDSIMSGELISLGIAVAIWVAVTVISTLLLLYCAHTHTVEKYLRAIAEK